VDFVLFVVNLLFYDSIKGDSFKSKTPPLPFAREGLETQVLQFLDALFVC
jgi:hypothetical protein